MEGTVKPLVCISGSFLWIPVGSESRVLRSSFICLDLILFVASSVYILPDVMRVSCDMCQARSSSMEQGRMHVWNTAYSFTRFKHENNNICHKISKSNAQC